MRRGAEAARSEAATAPALNEAVSAGGGEEDKAWRSSRKRPLTLKNGWLAAGGLVVTGRKYDPLWWRGNIRPEEAPNLGPAITRFAPARDGWGLTDDLVEVADDMRARGMAVYDHHYGLWYDRRRDDHLMERRADGEVAPPFYEQPFARSGRGRAWDGLSKYDLTKFNPWYWSRLHDFARLCDERGLVLVHQNFFQHNILEAGAHWIDSPWRAANNVTASPMEPPLVGDKRVFAAPNFYDPSATGLRRVQRAYIRQCLDAFADCSNVVQATSAEYSGPREFVEFWLDVVSEWEDEHKKDVLVALSAPKDVQDAILADEKRAERVDMIDIRYWSYTADKGLYAPRGGQNLAPRQHLRQTRQKPGGAEAIFRAVHEYKSRFPGKAVTYFADENCPSAHNGWAVLMGGGSLADLRLPEELGKDVAEMAPMEGVVEGGWCLGRAGGGYLIYAEGDAALNLTLPPGKYRVTWVDGKVRDVNVTEDVVEGGEVRLERRGKAAWLWRIVE
jgi:hypothetical protein